MATMNRVLNSTASTTPREYLASGIESAVLRLDGIGGTSVIVRDTLARVPFQHGRTLALVLYSLIPRVIWPGKPAIRIGDRITEDYGGNPEIESNTAATQVAEYYLNFGIAGVIGDVMLFGSHSAWRKNTSAEIQASQRPPAPRSSCTTLSFVLNRASHRCTEASSSQSSRCSWPMPWFAPWGRPEGIPTRHPVRIRQSETAALDRGVPAGRHPSRRLGFGAAD